MALHEAEVASAGLSGAHPQIRLLSWKDALVALGAITAVISHLTQHIEGDSEMSSAWGVAQLAWLFLVTLGCAFRAMERADAIAIRLGEPFGTIVLTLSAIAIEISVIAAVMLTVSPTPTAARDTMFAVLMILLGAFLGAAVIVGGMRSKRQFNLESSSTYISLIAALAAIGLILPRFTESAPGGYMWPPTEIFVSGACLLVYVAFVWRQTTIDREDFAFEPDAAVHEPSERPSGRAALGHAGGLVATLLVITFLAEGLGTGVLRGIEVLHLPRALAGVVVAALILLPEGLAGLKSAVGGHMQRSVNVLLGSALSTIGLTIPAVLLLANFTGTRVELGLEGPEIVLLCTTLFVTAVNFSRGRVGFSQGMVHVVLFLAWIALMFDG